MLKAKRMPNVFWAEAIACAIHLLNRASSKSVKDMTPQELGVVINRVLDT